MDGVNAGRRGEYVLRIPVRARPGHTGEILRCSGFGPMMVGTNSWVLEVPGDDAGEAIVVSRAIGDRIGRSGDTDADIARITGLPIIGHIPKGEGFETVEAFRVLRPGGTMAITIPRFGPELINWALSDEYHMVPGGHVRIYRRSVIESRLESTGLKVTQHHYAHGLHSPYWWLKCLVGTTNDANPAVSAYHRLLVWDIEKAPRVTRTAERILNPLCGKSLVVYLVKPAEDAERVPVGAEA